MNVNKMISLIDRIGLKLPCKNGKKLKTLEADVLIQHMGGAYSNIPSNDISMMTNLWKFYHGTSVESPSKETSNHQILQIRQVRQVHQAH
ncbi:unnamed protein product [Rhizophagus irregularis]|nr:unnamed protein product [Rhizophagus irregularis]CAB5383357.1 unnamed protein product [Rhizophagus irregularis]